MSKKYTFSAAIFLYPGDAAWRFIPVPQDASYAIKEAQQGLPRKGWGSVPVSVTIGDSTWNTSIFPTKEGGYLLPVKASIRTAERVHEGDTVRVVLVVR